MTSVFTARRRAEEFHALLEGSSTAPSSGTRFGAYVDLIDQLRDLEPPAPRPEFSASLREELMSAADTLLQPSADAERLTLPPRRSRDRRLAVAVGGLAIVGATGSLAVAAQSALPGEVLYPLKRVLESAQTQVQTSPQAKADSLLADATTRLDEATELTRGGDLGDAPAIAASFDDFAAQAQQGSDIVLAEYAESGDDASIEKLNDFTGESLDTLVQLEDMVPPEAHDELLHAVQVLDRIDAEAARACPDCAGGIGQIPSSLLVSSEQTIASTVVVPGTTLPWTGPRQAPKGDRDQDHHHGSLPGGTDLTDPLTDGELSPPPATGGGDTEDSPTGPLEDLTDDLTGTGGGTTTTDNGGLDDTVDDVGNGVGDTVDDTGDALDDTIDDVTDGLDDAVTDLPDLP